MANQNQNSNAGYDSNGVINQSNPKKGVFEFDISIVSTLTTDLTIELFNPESSQLVTANPAINTYVPSAPFYLGTAGAAKVTASLKGGTANQYMGGLVHGSNDLYINAAGIIPTGNTNNVCYFDYLGNAIYQPGYVGGNQTVGNVIISCTQNGLSYKHIMDWASNNTFDLHSVKQQFSELGQIQNPLLIVRRNVLGLSTQIAQVTPQNSKDNTQFQTLLLNSAVEQKMMPNVGIRYNMSAFTTNGAQTVLNNFYFSVKDEAASLRRAMATGQYTPVYKTDANL